MPICKNNPTRKYKGTEPSPKGFGWCASGEKIGKKRKGTDGNMWVIRKVSNGSKRWMKYSKTKVEKKTGSKTGSKTCYKINKSNNKIDCSKFVQYEKKTKGFFSNSVKILEGLKGRKGYMYKFIDFNNFENKETEIPEGYKYVKHSKNWTIWVKKYKCDSSKQVLTKNNSEYKKIKKEMVGYKKYFTHNNGGRPYLVYVGKSHVYIYMRDDKKYYIDWDNYSDDDKKNAWMYIKLVGKYKPTRVFIGKSPLNEMTGFSGGYGKRFDGNSILLKIAKNRYVFIGAYVYEFSTNNDNIIAYWSPVGNNDVPYPFAYGEKNIYFMLDDTYVPIDKFPELKKLSKVEKTDLYKFYYGHTINKIKYEKFAKKMKSKIISNEWE